jgi:hypothetical protein
MRRRAVNSASPLVAGLLTASIFMAGAGAYELGRATADATPPPAVNETEMPAVEAAAAHTVESPAIPAPAFEDSRPMVVLVIDDAGIDPARTSALIDLPVAMTFSFLPYALQTPELARSASAQGHDIFLHMPMEPVGLEDPGPGALTRHLPPDRLSHRVEAALARVPGAIGLNNHMGSAFTTDADALRSAFAPLAGRDLIFLDSLTSGRSRAAQIAREIGLETLQRDIFIDHVAGGEFEALDAMAARARREGGVIAIAHPRDGTVAALTEWLAGAEHADLRFVTVSDYLAARQAGTRTGSNETVGLFGGAE